MAKTLNSLSALSALLSDDDVKNLNETEVVKTVDDTKKHAPVTLFYERKGRGGKEATIIAGFEVDDSELADIASTIKKRLGAGGSARDGEILVQGDRREALRQLLPKLGFKVKG